MRGEFDDPVVVIGAGPGGLTAAYQLGKGGVPVTVVEATDTVGGISQTVERDGWRFDIGGHRFFTKVAAVRELWHEILPADDFLSRPRLSRIMYRGALFDYPLRPLRALRQLGAVEALRCLLSFLWAKVRPPADQSNFEGWVAARFGYRLYRIFFKTYTEKVWGIPATQIQADWAAQRIKNLNLVNAVLSALKPRGGTEITTLIERFDYPRYGPGMMWERARDLVLKQGGEVLMETPVVAIERRDGGATAVTVVADGARHRIPARAVVSSMPLPALVRAMNPAPPPEVLEAADGLHYRDFLTVALVVPQAAGFPDNWIYIHTPGVRVGRVQNFGSWSPFLVKEGRTCLGLEYFVNEGDELWEMADADLVELGTRELGQLGLVEPSAVERGYAVRIPKAYPVYDPGYADRVDVLRRWLAEHVPNVHPVGRNGMHKYNNQDHSMLTAMLAAENILGARHDTWSVNVEEEYHEDGRHDAGTGRAAPVTPIRPERGTVWSPAA
jgi:protoporphyrinogen oxidase